MSLLVPNALALANIADGSAIVASDHRNNYAAVQVGVNGLIAMFNLASAKGDLLVATAAGTFDRLPVGANGTSVVADSAQPLGLKYGAAGSTTYRKTTAKAVNTTVAATDLLNAEITLAALTTTNVVRLTAWGDWFNNSGGAVGPPRFQLVLGATTLLDTGTSGGCTNAATKYGWKIVAEIMNLGATNAQDANLVEHVAGSFTSNPNAAFTTGEGVIYCNTPSALAVMLGEGRNSSAVDTSTAKALILNVINASASASYETKLLGALVEII